MKKLLMIALIACSSNAFAESDIDAATGVELKASLCKVYGDISTTIMTRRQRNDNMAELLAAMPQFPLVTDLTRYAYELPLQSTKEMKEGIIKDFANATISSCYDNS
jgi:hypothetical protein